MRVLIIDDDFSVTASLGLLLKQAGYRTQSAVSPEEGLAALAREPCDLVIQDMNFSRQTTGEEGMALLKAVRTRWPGMPVILITAWGSIPLAVEGIKAGATDFITKPWTHEQILQAVKTALGVAAATAKTGGTVSREALDAQYDFHALIGRDPKLLRVLELAGRISATDASVLITGESGAGKELIADAIHANSPRRDKALVKVNLGGIPASLFESELFGHVRGAFTDARQDRAGRFALADRGTIFLDEIGDLAPACQVKLLRVLQDRTYEMLGSSKPRTVDVRVISATNRDLAGMVERGDFREDLLYRLNLITIHVPALRERPGDIPLLARHLLETVGHVYRRNALSISEEAMRWLQGQPWPGNIRQLRQVIERAVLVADHDRLEENDFALSMTMRPGEAAPDPLPPVGRMTLDEMEKGMILKSLEQFDGNISKVAEALGLSRAALYRRFEKHGIRP
jgi:DNA-binding NtrC family response regulator